MNTGYLIKCRSLLILILISKTLLAQKATGRPDPEFHPDVSSIAQSTISGLRNSSPVQLSEKLFYITDPGREGLFRYNPADKSTPDDSAITLVTRNGLRFTRVVDQGQLNIRWFGAVGDGRTDDWNVLQKGINYILNNASSARTLYFPPGEYRISRPLIIARFTGSNYLQASINLAGPANAKDLAVGTASIIASFNNTFAIGIQLGKGVEIRNLAVKGQFLFPNWLNSVQVDTLTFREWTDGSARDNQFSPYAGIVIDPFSDSTAYPGNSDMYPGLHAFYPKNISRGGSTAVQIIGCSVTNFIVGVMITPSNQQNGELIDVIDCDISSNKVGYAMGQAQSKECHVNRLKCWGHTHTLFDNVNYGFRHGDGAAVPMVDGVNIADAVKQLCFIRTPSFSGSFRNVYAEELFRIGFAGGPATVSFEDCQFDFATLSPGRPYPDFYILGSGATFHNCMLRSYTGYMGMRLVLAGTNNRYEGGTMNEPPVAMNLDRNGNYPHPTFDNVGMYYPGGILGNSNPGFASAPYPLQGTNGRALDPIYYGNTYWFRDQDYGADLVYKLSYRGDYERIAQIKETATIHVNKSNWTAFFKLPLASDASLLRVGDFILTYHLRYQDECTDITASTYPVGFIQNIRHDTVYLANLAYGIREGMKLSLCMDYYVNETPPFTGDIAAGSNTVVHVQGVFPAVGDRPDMPMLPLGTYVTATDPKAGTISFSNVNTHQSFSDYTFMNGYPAVEMYSAFDLPVLQTYNKTLIGGAMFYRYDAIDINTSHEQEYPVNGTYLPKYKILSTNIRGDTSLHKLKYLTLTASP